MQAARCSSPKTTENILGTLLLQREESQKVAMTEEEEDSSLLRQRRRGSSSGESLSAAVEGDRRDLRGNGSAIPPRRRQSEDWREIRDSLSFSCCPLPEAHDGDDDVSSSVGVEWFAVSLHWLCKVSLAAPLGGLAACLVVSLVFQFYDIQETWCKVSEIGRLGKVFRFGNNFSSEKAQFRRLAKFYSMEKRRNESGFIVLTTL